jgi:mycothiol system anti-sigma-R factor
VSDDELTSLFPTDCARAIHELYSYLDGELTESSRLEIARHLERCVPCGAAASFEVELRAVLVDRCHDRVPRSLRERIAAALDKEASDVRRP